MAYVIRHLGRVTFLLFLMAAVSGIMLAFYYRPSSPYSSVSYITKYVQFGLLTRSVHHWSAYLLILLIPIHVLRSLLQGRYKVSRRSWVVGSLMGIAILGCSFTGSLLIWDQRAYWATIIGIGVVETTPYIGGALKAFLLGGSELSTITIGRLHVLHTLMLPALVIAFMILHLQSLTQLWEFLFDLMRRVGVLGRRERGDLNEMDAPAFSGLLLEVMEIFSTIGLVLLLALLFPPEMGEKANPLVTPPEVKPEWYFLFIYQGLKYVPKVVGVVVFFLALPMLIIFLPLLDRSPSLVIHPVKRPLASILVVVALVALLSLTILGLLA